MTEQQKYEIGFEIVAGMHASAYNQDIERGREETRAGTVLPTPEELATQGLTEIPDYCYRAVEWETKRLNDQITWVVYVLQNKLREMGLHIVPVTKEAAKDPSQSYNERVRAIAEEMRDTVTPERGISAGQYMYARIAIKRAADIVRSVLSPNHTPEYIHGWLLSEGLIPDKEGQSSQFTKFLRGYGGIPDQEAGENER